MKKVLLATSALVAATVMTSPAGAQQVSAKAPFEITFGGWAAEYLGVVPSETSHYAGGAANIGSKSSYDARTDTRIIFDAHSRADNGLLYGVFIRLDADTAQRAVTAFGRANDRANVYFDSTWGRVQIGDNKSPTYNLLHNKVISADYAQPGGDADGFNGLADGPLYSVFLSTALAGAITNLSYFGDVPFETSNATKFYYMSPKFMGFQGGISFAPDGTNRGGNGVDLDTSRGVLTFAVPTGLGAAGANGLGTSGNSATSLAGTGDGFAGAGNLRNVIEAAVTYGTQVDPGVGPVDIYAGVGYSNAKVQGDLATAAGVNPVKAFNDLNSIFAGLKLGYAGFKVGFGLTYDGKSRLPTSDYARKIAGFTAGGGTYNASDAYGYAIGLEYLLGPWVVGGYYHNAHSAGSVRQVTVATGSILGGNTLEDEQVALSYLLAPGLQLMTSINNYDYHDDGAILGTISKTRAGQVYLMGTAITF